jgi:DICT domain-containing protein
LVVLACVQHAGNFAGATAARYTTIARAAPFVGVFGTGLAAAPAPGVRGSPLAAGDPLAAEWNVVVVGPHFSAALVARDLGGARDHHARFAHAVTYDRGLVLEAARALLRRTGRTA